MPAVTLASQIQCSFTGHDQSGSSARLCSAAVWSNFRIAYPRSAYIRLTFKCSAPSLVRCSLVSDLQQVLAVFIPEPMRLVLVIDGLNLDLELVARTTRVRGWQAKFKVPATESSIVEVCEFREMGTCHVNGVLEVMAVSVP